jgi:citrate synthase
MEASSPVHIGLEGIVVAETRLSRIDGAGGALWIAGRPVEELAASGSLEGAAARLWDRSGVDFGAARVDAFGRLAGLGDALDRDDGMDALRAAIASLPEDRTAEEIVAATAVFAAAWWRRRIGEAAVPPDPDRSHAADYWRMVHGRDPDDAVTSALAAYLISVIDHGLNASTFAARVVASTGSDLVSAITAAIGALKGPLHGGAPGPVLDALDVIGTPKAARAWVEAELGAGRRIMGIGHRVYRARDPRVTVLERAAATLGARAERLALARALEEAATEVLGARYPSRNLRANVELMTAVLLDAAGFDRHMFSPTFAVGRVIGWCAHVVEERAHGRLIRPASRYVGEADAEEEGEA